MSERVSVGWDDFLLAQSVRWEDFKVAESNSTVSPAVQSTQDMITANLHDLGWNSFSNPQQIDACNIHTDNLTIEGGSASGWYQAYTKPGSMIGFDLLNKELGVPPGVEIEGFWNSQSTIYVDGVPYGSQGLRFQDNMHDEVPLDLNDGTILEVGVEQLCIAINESKVTENEARDLIAKAQQEAVGTATAEAQQTPNTPNESSSVSGYYMTVVCGFLLVIGAGVAILPAVFRNSVKKYSSKG